MIMGMCIGCSPYNAEQSVIMQAIAVLRRFGTNAHIYLPGVGMLNGLQAGNYLDSAGTTVGTVDQPVGLVLDAAGSLGVELSPGTGTTVGWSAINATLVSSGGNIVATATVAGANAVQVYFDVATTIGATYKVSEGVVGYTATLMTGLALRATTTAFSIISQDSLAGPELGELHFVATATTTRIIARLDATFVSGASTLTLNASSVREVTGIAASQPTTASKPILRRGAVNVALQSKDLSSASWNKFGTASAPNATTANIPALGDRMFQLLTTVAGPCTVAVELSGTGTVSFGYSNGVDTYQQVTLTSTPTIYALNFTATTSTYLFATRKNSGDTATSVTITASALFAGTYTAQQIQALGGIPTTTTVPASTALGPTYWAFDGSNDSLSLGGPLFQMADDHCVVAGAMSSTTSTMVISAVARSTAGVQTAAMIFTSANTVAAGWRDTADSVGINPPSASISANTPFVASARKIGNAKELRRNSVSSGVNNNPAGVAAIDTGSIGSNQYGNFFNGNIYPVIAIKGTVTDPDLVLLEKFVANLSGVAL